MLAYQTWPCSNQFNRILVRQVRQFPVMLFSKRDNVPGAGIVTLR